MIGKSKYTEDFLRHATDITGDEIMTDSNEESSNPFNPLSIPVCRKKYFIKLSKYFKITKPTHIDSIYILTSSAFNNIQ